MRRLPTRGGSLVLNRRENESAKPIGFDMTHRRLDVAIVADDLTGALDAAAPFAGRGLKTRVLLDIERVASAVGSDIQVLSLTSESRHLLPARSRRARLECDTCCARQDASCFVEKNRLYSAR